MALDLEIKIHKPINIDELSAKTQQTFCLLLRLNLVGKVIISPYLKQIDFNYNGTFTVVFSELAEDKVEMTFTVVPSTPGYEDPDEEGWWAGVTVRASLGAPLKLVLAAALAITLAELQQSSIKDERRAWTSEVSTTPDILLEKATVPKWTNSLHEALNLFAEQTDAGV
jgi:hypothetical protein